MARTSWVHTLVRALHSEGGEAHAFTLARSHFVVNEQNPQHDMEATIRGSVQDFSSDHSSGRKKGASAGNTRDVFQKVGPATWRIRDYNNPLVQFALGQKSSLEVREAIDPQEADLMKDILDTLEFDENEQAGGAAHGNLGTDGRVFVREHWRDWPGQRVDVGDLPDDERLSPHAAWCTNTHLEVELVSGTKLSSPIEWYPRLLAANPLQRSLVQLSPYGLHWDDLDEDISIKNLLFGTRGIPPKPR